MRSQCWFLILAAVVTHISPGMAAEPPVFHTVSLPVQSPRLLGMSMDEDGFIWVGSTHRTVYCYDPRTGFMEEIRLPYDSSTSQTICVGRKVYLLGQTYPKLMIYDRRAREFREVAFPTTQPDVWYGTEAVDGKHLYLFDRGSAGVIKWDAITDTGTSIAFPYELPSPTSGRYTAADGAVWCNLWDLADGQYVPLGLARLDATTDKFTGWFPFPKADSELAPFANPETTVFYPYTLKGKLVPFDWRERRWCQAIDVPDFGRRFGFIGGGTAYDGRWYFSISTYNGTATGCDGKPYHFCNGLLQFDPQTRRFAFPSVDVDGAYFQVAYTLSAGGHLFATGNNIREQDGSLNMSRTGEAIFWQTLRPKREGE
jgi:hypothetical protein